MKQPTFRALAAARINVARQLSYGGVAPKVRRDSGPALPSKIIRSGARNIGQLEKLIESGQIRGFSLRHGGKNQLVFQGLLAIARGRWFWRVARLMKGLLKIQKND
jgi:hypothetical protein